MEILDRFLKYISFDTTSSEESETVPTTAKQLELAKFIVEDMKTIGIENARMDKYGYVYGELSATLGCKNDPIGFISHMDTSPAVSGANIKPRVFKYLGGDIKLNDKVSIKNSEFNFLKNYIGQELVVTDGTTLLGADDKAGISEIMSAMEYLINHNEIKHGKIFIGVTPDEEVGSGADHFDLKNFKAKYAYTVDGGTLGELEYENFNAASVKITINGINIHPGSAKNKMKNAILVANDLMNMMPKNQIPAKTEKYEGFYHIGGISGDESLVKINMLIRDHDKKKFEAKKNFIKDVEKKINKKYGEETCEIVVKDSYYNMKEKIEPVMYIIDKAKKAFLDAGVTPKTVPIRGGTDGARLSYEGLPCPNLSTGGENFHGIHEFVSVDAMKKMVEVIVNLSK